MNAVYINSGANTGRYNMDFDLKMAGVCREGDFYLRFYTWNPYCISLGNTQSENELNKELIERDGLDFVKRPTGGRAILHAEELTYSVALKPGPADSIRAIYQNINAALKKGLIKYNSVFNNISLEEKETHLPSFYKTPVSAACFAVPAKSELTFDGKKLAGSAQRRLGSRLLQHGSLLTGTFHRKLHEYLTEEVVKTNVNNALNEKTVEIDTVLNEKTDIERLKNCLRAGFEEHFGCVFIQKDDEFIFKAHSLSQELK